VEGELQKMAAQSSCRQGARCRRSFILASDFEALPWAGIRRVGEWPQFGTQKKLRMTKPMMDRLGSRARISFLCADAVAVAAINRESS
jgi:hypothetical protein